MPVLIYEIKIPDLVSEAATSKVFTMYACSLEMKEF